MQLFGEKNYLNVISAVACGAVRRWRGAIDSAIGFQQYSVVSFERSLADQAGRVIACHLRRWALAWVAVAITARGLKNQRFAGRYRLFTFALHALAGTQCQLAGRAILAAEAAARRLLFTITWKYDCVVRLLSKIAE
jgi:hypothetical protein